MSSPDDLVSVNKTCPCGARVWRVHRLYNIDIDTAPASVGATGPYFASVNDRMREIGAMSLPTSPEYTIHAAHHCAAPALCRRCEQVHQAPAMSGFNRNNENESGNAA